MTDTELHKANDLIDELATAVRRAAACLRNASAGSERDGATLSFMALDALEAGEEAMKAYLANPSRT